MLRVERKTVVNHNLHNFTGEAKKYCYAISFLNFWKDLELQIVV